MAHRLRMHLVALLDEQRQLIRGRNLLDIALWRLDRNDVLAHLDSLEDPVFLLQPLNEYFQCTRASHNNENHSPELDDMGIVAASEMMQAYDMEVDKLENSGGVPQSSDEGHGSDAGNSDIDSDDEDDHMAADALTDTSTSVQQLLACETNINIQLPMVSDSSSADVPISLHSRWKATQPVPSTLPPIAMLFSVIDQDPREGGIRKPEEFCIWSVATSAMASTEAPRVPSFSSFVSGFSPILNPGSA